MSDKRIIFCIPPLDMGLIVGEFGGVWEIGSSMPPQGLCQMAAVSRKKGYDVKILDSHILRLTMDEAVRSVTNFKPDYVGISSTTVSIKSAGIFAKKIKEALPSAVTIIGGAHVSALPVETMEEFSGFDVGVIGEGEITFHELVEAMENKSDLSGVPGLVYRESDIVRRTAPRAFIKDLDSLPIPAWDMCPPLAKHYRTSSQRCIDFPVASIVTSRGCPYNCSFCDRSVFGHAIRAHSAGYVMEMIKELKYKHGIRALVFNDDLFVAIKKRLTEICEMMIRERINMSWSCNSRVDMLNPETLKLMKRAGCWQITVGIESGDSEILAEMNKETDLGSIEGALKLIKDAGMSIKGLFIIGMPHDTKITIERTIKFAKDLPIDDAQFSIFTPYPGSELYKDVVEKEGFKPEWEKMNTTAPSYVPKGLTAGDLLYYQKKASKEFYLRLRPILHQLSKLGNPRYAVNVVREALSFLKYIYKD